MGSDAAGERRWPGCCALALLVWQDLLLIANAGGKGHRSKFSVHAGLCAVSHCSGAVQSLPEVCTDPVCTSGTCRALLCLALHCVAIAFVSQACNMCLVWPLNLPGLPGLQGTAGQCCAGQAKRCS